uniref:Uncharacterized protein n=1 Tax=Tanacetum cinerariifolium TaxID=118510 RepID=A0A6L2M4P2_TANCI|nr:hypothetical protein [Tanacetum cinerariifolium]
MTLDDFRTIFQLPQATDNNHERFVDAPKFSEMVSFFINNLGFTLELRSPSNFKETGVVQPWQKLCKMLSRCLTPRLEISRRVHDKYHNLEHDEMVKSIFNSKKNKVRVGMKNLSWMIIDKMKLASNYRMYAAVFEVDVLTTRSQPIESTQGTHRTTSAPRLRIPPRRSTRLALPTPILTADEGEDKILQDTIQLSIVEQKSRDDFKAKKIKEKVKEYLMAEEIKKLVKGTKNVGEDEVDNSILNNDPDARLKPKSYKESSKVEKTNVVSQPVNIIEDEDESAEDDYELRRREQEELEETRNTPPPTPTRSTRIHSTLISSYTKKPHN